jgi:WD40 repeat protein
MWNLTNQRRAAALSTTLTGPSGSVYALAFSPDGHTLAAGKTDHTVGLWDVVNLRQPQKLATLTGPNGAILTVAFNPDGHTVAASGGDKTIRLWNTNPDIVAAHICAVAGERITREEWSQYIPGRPYDPPCH